MGHFNKCMEDTGVMGYILNANTYAVHATSSNNTKVQMRPETAVN